MLNRIKARTADERGAVLVFVAILMVAILASAALAIDSTAWNQTQRQAQNAADAAALAAANDLPNSPGTATTDAQSYVNQNLPGATTTVTTPYNSSANQVKVTVTATGQSTIGGFFKVNPVITASSVAAETATSTLCSTPGTGCDAIFAMDSSCTSGHYSITFSGGGNTITGGMDSNGSISAGGGGSAYGPTTYGPTASGCTVTAGGGSYTSGPTSAAPTCPTCWPIPYATDFPSCTGAACTGLGGTPSFCTQVSTSTSWSPTPTSRNIYCDVGSGSGVSAGNPATWNGAITVSAGGSSSSPMEATYVAGSVSIAGGGGYMEACGYSSTGYTASGCNAAGPTPATPNYPLIYAVGPSSTAINGGGGGTTFIGDLFAPNGTIYFGGGGNTTSFLEGKDVSYTGGGLTGDGPSDSGIGGSSSGSASLVQ
jgi:Flp pilus assembly protein TadG